MFFLPQTPTPVLSGVCRKSTKTLQDHFFCCRFGNSATRSTHDAHTFDTVCIRQAFEKIVFVYIKPWHRWQLLEKEAVERKLLPSKFCIERLVSFWPSTASYSGDVMLSFLHGLWPFQEEEARCLSLSVQMPSELSKLSLRDKSHFLTDKPFLCLYLEALNEGLGKQRWNKQLWPQIPITHLLGLWPHWVIQWVRMKGQSTLPVDAAEQERTGARRRENFRTAFQESLASFPQYWAECWGQWLAQWCHCDQAEV